MGTGKFKVDTTIANSLVAKVQLGLPSTVTKLTSKMRFIDEIAPNIRQSGIVRTVSKKTPLNLNVAGIATANKAIPAFGGVIFSAGAVRQDLSIDNGSVYQTYQDSLVDIDEADDIDVNKKLNFIHIIQVYNLLEQLMNEENPPELVLVDTPLILERSDAPLESHVDLLTDYKKCIEQIEQFWRNYKEKMFPFNSNGVRLVSLSTKRFGSVFYGLTSDKRDEYLIDAINKEGILEIEHSFSRIKRVGVKKLLHGVLTRRTRTAAYQYDILTPNNRIEPKDIRDLGLINFHLRAGMNTSPLLAEMIGTKKNWSSDDIDELTSNIVSLVTIDQYKALPLPLWYANYALKPIKSGTIIHYYKAQAKEMIKNEEIEKVWAEEIDLFGEDEE